MKKFIAFILLIAVIISLFFIQVTQQTEVVIKAPLFTMYSSLASPLQWEKWRADLRKILPADSARVTVRNYHQGFILNYAGKGLRVDYKANSFFIKDSLNGTPAGYDFTLLPHKLNDSTSVLVSKQTNVIKYLIGLAGADQFADTHVGDLKYFMETDSLRYGFPIHKITVVNSNIVAIKRRVLTINQFRDINNMLKSLQEFVERHQVKQIEPLLAVFRPHGKDSTDVEVGMVINKPVKPEGEVILVEMPKGSVLYRARFSGKFNQRSEVYAALTQYFADHGYQQPVPPFENYLNDKLPASADDHVEMLVNFGSYH